MGAQLPRQRPVRVLGRHDTKRPNQTPKQPESEGPDMPRTHNPQDNWTIFRDLLEQFLDTLETQTEIIKSMLKEGDHADHLDFVAEVISYEPMNLQFDTSSVIVCMDDLRAEAIAETSMTKRAKQLRPSRDDFPNARKTWTTEEDNQLWAALLLGHNYQWIAHHLSRTPRAIQRRIDKLQGTGQL